MKNVNKIKQEGEKDNRIKGKETRTKKKDKRNNLLTTYK